MTKSKCKYVGVDGCTCGWISIGIEDGGDHEVKVFAEFGDLVDYYSAACLILVDIPIGLPKEGPAYRGADCGARKELKSRKSSVFKVPTREQASKALEMYKEGQRFIDSYHWMNKRLKATNNSGISTQSYGIWRKIAEVDEILTGRDKPSNVREVHPEVCFWALNGKKAVSPKKIRSKINPDGMDERKRVLRHSKLQIDDIFKCARSKFPRKTAVGDDDILDALVAAVTAKLGCQDNAYKLRTLPECPPKDCEGLLMEMVYAIRET